MYCSHSFCSTKQHIDRCRYRVQYVKQTDGTAAERESGDCSRAEYQQNRGQFCTEGEEILRVEGAGIVEGDVRTKKAVHECCLFFDEILMQLVKKREKKEVRKHYSTDFRRQL